MRIFKLVLIVFSLIIVSCKPTKYADLEDGMYADMITNKGTILLKLEFEKTPITVANFVSLAEGSNEQVVDSLKGKHFYDGLVFHRVIKDFMCQGGDPLATGSGDPGYKFIDEFPKDSVGNLLLKHDKAGVLSMANSGPATNGSQFFITYKDTPWLDGKHTVFGNVIKGHNVVDSIAQNDTIKTLEIIKVGKLAKKFKGGAIFSKYFIEQEKESKLKEERLQAVFSEKLKSFKENNTKGTELPSGLKFVITETKDGEKPVLGSKVKVNYAGYFTTGKLFDTSFKEVAKAYETYDEHRDAQNGYAPFETVYGPEARLIPGFREGLQQMKLGDKAMLFIPSHLGYGAQGAGSVIPPNSDLVFELELVEVVK
ncbi:peptidylprolyl isomerase [Lutibacter flavus]|uniref:peptidylprolyl isomerase n=1 Tax=Lutibacter flavus TaxID=691689 RepID=A0A238VXL2_9FLAO|nr:peptidylprolyl isomerase [Lutibacter flavus]SNR39052.1 Peptidyl-prolyl cis-trans isomerase (rotamase) -cyclophilin family [Lutibacter flavus]